MVLVILTKAGLTECQENFFSLRCPIWVNGGILSKSDADRLRALGVDLTAFASFADLDDAAQLANMMDTIRMHHPEACIFVEQP